jgi:hypothetical protein
MFPRSLSDHVDLLINALIEEGSVDSASLASILVTAQDSVDRGYSLELSRQVWLVANELRSVERPAVPAEPEPSVPVLACPQRICPQTTS